MTFIPGQGGRKPGAQNKDKRIVREILEAALGRSLPEEVLRTLDGLPPSKRCEILVSLMPYCYPKLQSIQVQHEELNSKSELVDQMMKRLLDIKDMP